MSFATGSLDNIRSGPRRKLALERRNSVKVLEKKKYILLCKFKSLIRKFSFLLQQHRVMPVSAVVSSQTAISPSPDRGRTISTNSTNSNASSIAKENNNNCATSGPCDANNTSPNKDADLVACEDKAASYLGHHTTTTTSSSRANNFYTYNSNDHLINRNYSSSQCFASSSSTEYTAELTTGYCSSAVFAPAAVSFTDYSSNHGVVDKDCG